MNFLAILLIVQRALSLLALWWSFKTNSAWIAAGVISLAFGVIIRISKDHLAFEQTKMTKMILSIFLGLFDTLSMFLLVPLLFAKPIYCALLFGCILVGHIILPPGISKSTKIGQHGAHLENDRAGWH